MNKELSDIVKPGDLLIFTEHGGVLSAKKGNVFTFANWYNSRYDNQSRLYWQCKELLSMGNKDHNFSIRNVELFDIEVHKEARIMTPKLIEEDYNDFISKYGA